MKTYKHIRLTTIFSMLILFLLVGLNINCKGACIEEWKECRTNCPTQDEGEQAVQDCLRNCNPNEELCMYRCTKLSREKCTDLCGDQLSRCLDKEQ